MKRIPRACVTNMFDPLAAPVAEAVEGEELVFETLDALGGRVHTHADALSVMIPNEQGNPATGPVFITGARPGDTLAVTILSIRLGAFGYGRVKGGGVIFDELQPRVAVLTPVRDGEICFGERLRFPARPMVGVAGVAPPSPMRTFFPGARGGNLDINELQPGATLYLPVAAPGALLCIGDVHAAMGDGELNGGGLDIDAEVTVSARVHRGLSWPRPVIETPTAWCTCANAPSLQSAIRQACSDMCTLLAASLGMSREEAFILVGAAGDARIGQSAGLPGVDATAYLRIPKTILPLAHPWETQT